ncbi:MAG TPA: hypothetical protein VK609_06505, partial [Mucilaginibacter sp.]|nr:hypothetical protein [Mucilaginibacter sp.]
MESEKTINPPSGFTVFALFLVILVIAVICLALGQEPLGTIIGAIGVLFVLPGFIIVNPNESRVLT